MKRKLAALCLVLSIAFAAAWMASCSGSGMTLGENRPGRDTYLSAGAIAVDSRTETSFIVQATAPPDGGVPPDASERDRATLQTLYAVSPDTGAARQLADLTGTYDLRMLFPRDSIMLMAEHDGHDQLRLFDIHTLAETARVETTARYHGTRMAPSGRYIAVADNTSSTAPIHVVETSNLRAHVIPHGGDWLEAMWLNNTDRLFAIVFYGVGTARSRARILSWTMTRVVADGFPMGGDVWAAPDTDITVEGVDMDQFFSFTWIGVAPNDRTVVFPVRAYPNRADRDHYVYRLLVLDVPGSTIRTIDDARGPVGFTPDGATIVSYRYVARAVIPDGGVVDAGRADAGAADTGAADTGAADTGSPLDASAADVVAVVDSAVADDASVDSGDKPDADSADGAVGDVPHSSDGGADDGASVDAADAATDDPGEPGVPRDSGVRTVPQLLLIDAMTLAVRDMDLPLSGLPQFFVTREGHHVAVASAFGDEDVIIYDVDTRRMTRLRNSAIGLNEFVSRIGHHELWLVDRGLRRLDFMAATFESIALPWTPLHVNILPMRDLLVMDDAHASRVVFWSPASRTTARSVILPEPVR